MGIKIRIIRIQNKNSNIAAYNKKSRNEEDVYKIGFVYPNRSLFLRNKYLFIYFLRINIYFSEKSTYVKTQL